MMFDKFESKIAWILLAGVGVASCTPGHLHGDDKPLDHPDEFAKTFRLAPLSPTSARNEVRIWIIEQLMVGRSGTVVETGSIDTYATQYLWSESLKRTTVAPVETAALMHAFAVLAGVPEDKLSCHTLDHVDVVIEGVVDGTYFVYRASNPWSCEDDGPKRLAAALDALDVAATCVGSRPTVRGRRTTIRRCVTRDNHDSGS